MLKRVSTMQGDIAPAAPMVVTFTRKISRRSIKLTTDKSGKRTESITFITDIL
jgi:hypothetical protein